MLVVAASGTCVPSAEAEHRLAMRITVLRATKTVFVVAHLPYDQHYDAAMQISYSCAICFVSIRTAMPLFAQCS